MSMDDEFGDLGEAMGDDFGFGFGDEDMGDPNVKPKPPHAPEEVVDGRTMTGMLFRFPAHKQALETLYIQAMPADKVKNKSSPFASFSGDLGKGECQDNIPDPTNATQHTFNGLSPETSYYFRLVAKNPAGVTVGLPSEPISTLEFAPKRGLISGWMQLVRDSGRKDTLMRRLSLRGKISKRNWFVLNETSLTWAELVDEKVIGSIALKDIMAISGEEGVSESARLLILGTDNRSLELVAHSSNPLISAHDLSKTWIQMIQKQIVAFPDHDFGGSKNAVLF